MHPILYAREVKFMTEKTFSEALIAEWYRLNGWLVETGIPLVKDKTVKTGSRGEARAF